MPDRPTERFTTRVTDYAAHRPSYPDQAIDAVVHGLPPGSWAADIGAGTGISTRLLLDRGLHVHAVEPNAAMREHAQRDLAGHAVRWHATTGERTELPDASVSLVLCAQSLHWLEPAAAVAEFARMLIPAGRVCAVWNVHDTRDPLMAAYRELVMRHAVDPPKSPWFRNDDCALGTPAAARVGLVGYRLDTFPSSQTMDLPGLVGRAVSSSYMPQSGHERKAVERDLADLFATHQSNGTVTFRYVCEVHTTTLANPIPT